MVLMVTVVVTSLRFTSLSLEALPVLFMVLILVAVVTTATISVTATLTTLQWPFTWVSLRWDRLVSVRTNSSVVMTQVFRIRATATGLCFYVRIL